MTPFSVVSTKSAVAVIMSVYGNDKPELLSRAIDSVLGQRGIDDCAIHLYLGIDGPVSDAITAVIESYHDRLYRVMRFAKNRGLPHVLNDLIEAASEEPFLFRMDADDACYPDRFRQQLEYMDSHPHVDILGTAIREIHYDGFEQVVYYPEDSAIAVDNLYRRGPVAHPTVCFRRRVFDVIKGGYPCLALSEDIALWFECAKSGLQFANIQEPLLYFTVSENFWQRRGSTRAKVELGVWLRGIWALHGLSWRLLWPPARFLFRLSPSFIQKRGYASGFRKP